jgi:hypothetical protein
MTYKDTVFIKTRCWKQRHFLPTFPFRSVVRLDLIKGKAINEDREGVEALALKVKACTAATDGSILI